MSSRFGIDKFCLRWLWLIGALLFAFSVNAERANATVMELLSTSQLAERSDEVVVGRVQSVRSRLVLEAETARPYTFVEIIVERSIAGSLRAGERLTLQETGGAWFDETRASTIGNPFYREGERVLVFAQTATHLPAGRYRTTAMAQGKYDIIRGTAGDNATRDLRGLSFVTHGPFGGVSLRDGVFERSTSLSALIRAIQSRRGR